MVLLFLLCILMGLTQYHPLFVYTESSSINKESTHFMDVDMLSPFSTKQSVGTRRKNRISHDFYEVKSAPDGNRTAVYSVRSFTRNIRNNQIFGHVIFISNGKEMLSVLEPSEPYGCSKQKRATVLESSKQRKCLVAVNAGFFNQRTGQCFGNVISDGEEVNKFRGLKSANFGIRKDGSLVVGYLKETDIIDMRSSFEQLVSGVGWILRNGENYLNESFQHEQCNLENLENFFKLKSSRTMIGHDRDGNIVIVQVDGRTGKGGINLLEAVDLLLSFKLVNAINLNGGGTSTVVVNGTVANYPSNVCTNMNGKKTACTMEVSSILCVHQPDECVQEKSCTANGRCYKGKCKCDPGWAGVHCQFSTDGHLASCCWRNYYAVVVLSAIVAASVIGNIVLCDMYLLYRFRARDLSRPKRRQKDKLRMYLKETSVLMSSNEDMSSEQSLPK